MRKTLLLAVAGWLAWANGLGAQTDNKPAPNPGRGWESIEYLLWWNRDVRVPPLLTRARNGALPVLGEPHTTTLVGGSPLDTPDQSGMRFSVGWAADPSGKLGFEANYFFVGTRSTTFAGGGIGTPGSPAFGVPYVDAFGGSETVLPVTEPTVGAGALVLAASSRLQGTELNGALTLWAGSGLAIKGLLGFRYLEVDEGLQIQTITDSLVSSADQFDGHNRFYSGQAGLRASYALGPVFVEALGKLAAGGVDQVVRINGVTRFAGTGPADPLVSGGFFALPGNSGRHSRTVFGLVPELTLRAGLNFAGGSRLFVGYNLLCLTEAARPGDQIDRVLNASQIPRSISSQPFGGPDRPAFTFQRSEFWTQGLVVGLEWKY